MKQYWIAINSKRTSVSDGFANTWTIYPCSYKTQRQLLIDGLPISDTWFTDGTPCWSTRGIRIATSSEIRAAKREIEWFGYDHRIFEDIIKPLRAKAEGR